MTPLKNNDPTANAGPSSETIGVFFGAPNSHRDRKYFGTAPKIVEAFKKNPDSYPEIGKAFQRARQERRLLTRHILSWPTPLLGRATGLAVQTILMEGIAESFTARQDSPIECVSYFSAGSIPAFSYAGIFNSSLTPLVASPELARYHSAAMKVANQSLRSGGKHPIHHSQFEVDPPQNVGFLVEQALMESDLAQRIFVKDYRGPQRILLAGTRQDLAHFKHILRTLDPSLRSTMTSQTFGGHLPIIEPIKVSYLDGVAIAPPRCDLLTAQGELIPAHCDDRELIARCYADSLCKPMNTGLMMTRLLERCTHVLVVGPTYTWQSIKWVGKEARKRLHLVGPEHVPPLDSVRRRLRDRLQPQRRNISRSMSP